MFGRVHDVRIAPDLRNRFVARAEHWQVGNVVIGSYSTPAREVVRTARCCRTDGVDHWVLQVSRRGTERTRIGEATHCIRPGELVVSSYAASYAKDCAAGDWVAAMVPRNAFPVLSARLERLAPGPQTGAGARVLADFLLSVAARSPDARLSELSGIERAVSVMAAACPSEMPIRRPLRSAMRQRGIGRGRSARSKRTSPLPGWTWAASPHCRNCRDMLFISCSVRKAVS